MNATLITGIAGLALIITAAAIDVWRTAGRICQRLADPAPTSAERLEEALRAALKAHAEDMEALAGKQHRQ